MKKILLLFFLFPFLFVPTILAEERPNQYVTVVNPVRISTYTKDSSKSIAAQYSVIHERNLPATWLLTYPVLMDEKAINAIATFDSHQEIGLFLEVSDSLCTKAKVLCNEGSWHHANVIFLSGYSQEDRRKLIDTLFSEFKDIFGYYPKSVGSWWTDAYSLSYMQEKYGITANLTCSDQFSTDGYEIWGQYWSYPFMPSIFHAGMPAINKKDQLDIVTIQWAPREPWYGYESSLYSTQDYQTKPLDYTTEFLENLIKTYALKNKNTFGQITVGLEGDFNPSDYEGEYVNQIELIKKYSDENIVSPVSMSDFSKWYRNTYTLTEPTFVQSNETNNPTIKSYWYQSPHYRINILYDIKTSQTTIRDLRTYHSDFYEPYYSSRNNFQKLIINNPSYFDQMNNIDDVWNLDLGTFLSIEETSLGNVFQFTDGSIALDPSTFTIHQKSPVIPQILSHSQSIDVTSDDDSLSVTPKEYWNNKSPDDTYYALSEVSLHELARKRTKVIIITGILLWLAASFRIIRRVKNNIKKIVSLMIISAIVISIPIIWFYQNRVPYSVSQSELDVLSHLSVMPKGKVLVYDHECLGCDWGSTYKPATYANQKGYIANYSGHSVIYNKTIFEEKDLQIAKQEFHQLNVKYMYLTRYEGLEEKMPFSPGDFNIEKIYESANGELWRVKN
jgi:hypothetical protein